jgi:hypothetical protein
VRLRVVGFNDLNVYPVLLLWDVIGPSGTAGLTGFDFEPGNVLPRNLSVGLCSCDSFEPAF